MVVRAGTLEYVTAYDKVFRRVSGIGQYEYHERRQTATFEPTVYAEKFMSYWNILVPTPPPCNRQWVPSSVLLKANFFLMKGSKELVKFRREIATAGGHPVLYPYPELLPDIMDHFYGWILDWLNYMEQHPEPEAVDDFAWSVVHKIGVVPPFSGGQ